MAKEPYKNNLIAQFILRIDFTNNLQNSTNELPSHLTKAIATHFSHLVTSDVIKSEIQVSPNSLHKMDNPVRQWDFTNPKEPNTHITISPDSICYTTTHYVSFKTVIEHFSPIVEQTFNIPDAKICRTGIRYINLFHPDLFAIKSFYDWEQYINPSFFNLPDNEENFNSLSAMFTSQEYTYPESNIKCSFGFNNPQYPMHLIRPSLVLDYDGSCNAVLISSNDFHETVEAIHDRLETIFEKGITDKTREVMNEK